MSTHKSLTDVIKEVAKVSPLATKIVENSFFSLSSFEPIDPDEVVSAVLDDSFDISDKEAVKVLVDIARNALLRLAVLNERQQELPPVDTEMEDEELCAHRLHTFSQHIAEYTIQDLKSMYTRHAFTGISNRMKFLYARTLTDYTRSLGKEPLALWVSLVESNGTINV